MLDHERFSSIVFRTDAAAAMMAATNAFEALATLMPALMCENTRPACTCRYDEGQATMSRRRIVTGFNEQGKSIIISDGPSPASFQFGSFEWDELWAVDDLPATLDDPSDPADVERVYTLRPGAMLRASIVALPPESERQSSPSDADREEFARRVDVTSGVTRDPTDWKMHRTPTLDIIVVLSGELEMRLDGGQVVHVKSGDSVIQRGAMHAWQVLGDQPCVIVGFMMQGEFRDDRPMRTDEATNA